MYRQTGEYIVHHTLHCIIYTDDKPLAHYVLCAGVLGCLPSRDVSSSCCHHHLVGGMQSDGGSTAPAGGRNAGCWGELQWTDCSVLWGSYSGQTVVGCGGATVDRL